MAISRSAMEYLRRKGLVDESIRPSPRLNMTDLLVHTAPMVSPPMPAQSVLQGFEGDPSPDRVGSRPWPEEPGSA